MMNSQLNHPLLEQHYGLKLAWIPTVEGPQNSETKPMLGLEIL
jgi:hypothetical protein